MSDEIREIIGNMRSYEDVKRESPFTCSVCGKTDGEVDMLLGGFLRYAHEECGELACKIVDLWMEYLVFAEGGILVLADEIKKAYHRPHNQSSREE